MTADARGRPALTAPLALPPNRVARFYRDGALLERFRAGGTASLPTEATYRSTTADADGDRPEDWIASTLRAWTPVGKALSDEGLSVVKVGDEEVTLRELVQRRDPAAVGGNALVRVAGPTTGMFVKLLDAAQRLPVHCHPTRAFAERFMGSRWGKTEAWLILGTRQIAGEESPSIRLGFRRDVERAELRRWIDEQDVEVLLGAMHGRTVAPGDAWLVPAGMPHSIGAGVFLVELQEPTDFSIVAETDGFPIAPEDAHLGMGWDVTVDAFDRSGLSDDALEGLRQKPALVAMEGTAERHRLLGTDADPFFRAERVTLGKRGSMPLPWPDTFVLGIVQSGSGRIVSSGGSLSVRAGESFALPAAASTGATVESDEALEVIFCLPPDPDALASTGWRSRDAGSPS
ncbi:MAG: class I mannose-6-phosphate isomerase [Chloroflexota bacterium]|nr:class I mannose-6-phosphate isomerase [Chloroflexota bacterium]